MTPTISEVRFIRTVVWDRDSRSYDEQEAKARFKEITCKMKAREDQHLPALVYDAVMTRTVAFTVPVDFARELFIQGAEIKS
jgi:hypothetical protein